MKAKFKNIGGKVLAIIITVVVIGGFIIGQIALNAATIAWGISCAGCLG